MSDYKFDVFISYPHEEEHETWVHDIFLDDFARYLKQELGRQPELFVDVKGIKSGDSWPMKLKEALAHSKILVPIWSVDYFLSNWCRAECAVFLHREEKLGYRKSKTDGLIHPVQLYDGKRYPRKAWEIQWLNCDKYNVFNHPKSFKKSKTYSKLKRAIKDWTPDVAQAVEAAPGWKQEWLTQSWIEKAIKKWDKHKDFQILTQPWDGPTLAGG